MAITRTQNVSADATSVSITTPTSGDVIVVFAYRSATTAPTLATGYTTIDTQSASSSSQRTGYKVSNGTETDSGTWTNATSVVCHVYRGVNNTTPVGRFVHSSGTTTALWYGGGTTTTLQTGTAMGPQRIDGTSWIVGFAGMSAAQTWAAPSGMTQAVTSPGNFAQGSDTNAGVTGWPSTTVTASATGNWKIQMVELIDASSDGTKPLVDVVATPASTGAATSLTVALTVTSGLANTVVVCDVFVPAAPVATSHSDLVVDAVTNTIVTSASYTFVSGDVGRTLNVTSGTGWTVGAYTINSVASGAATLSSSPAATGTTGGVYNMAAVTSVSGATWNGSSMTSIFSSFNAGNNNIAQKFVIANGTGDGASHNVVVTLGFTPSAAGAAVAVTSLVNIDQSTIYRTPTTASIAGAGPWTVTCSNAQSGDLVMDAMTDDESTLAVSSTSMYHQVLNYTGNNCSGFASIKSATGSTTMAYTGIVSSPAAIGAVPFIPAGGTQFTKSLFAIN